MISIIYLAASDGVVHFIVLIVVIVISPVQVHLVQSDFLLLILPCMRLEVAPVVLVLELRPLLLLDLLQLCSI